MNTANVNIANTLVLFLMVIASFESQASGSRLFDMPQMGQVKLQKDMHLRVGITIIPFQQQKVMSTRGQLATLAKKQAPIVRTLQTNLHKSDRFALGSYIVEWTPKKWSESTMHYTGTFSIFKVGASSLVGEHIATEEVSGFLEAGEQPLSFHLNATASGSAVDKEKFPLLAWSVHSPSTKKRFKPTINVAKQASKKPAKESAR